MIPSETPAMIGCCQVSQSLVIYAHNDLYVYQYVTNAKWKWAGHVVQMENNGWTIRSTEWQIKGVRSTGRPTRRWTDDIVGQQGAVWTRTAKDRESWRSLAEGYFLPWKDTA